jgi:FMN-dependent oxidoreductase (nitrilotriacetate monooxygenase family)
MMKLGLFIMGGDGRHVSAWRHPSVPADANVNLSHFKRIAQTAERGLFDLLFFADTTNPVGPEDLTYWTKTSTAIRFEPLTLLSALAGVTENIGLVATVSTLNYEPMVVARLLGSLDLLSEGRTGWNIVTSASPHEAANFGRDANMDHQTRYARATEFTEVVLGLWDSFAPEAILADKQAGLYFDPKNLNILNHHGPNFSVRGPLTMIPSPQGRPVLAQAGQSKEGRDLAAQYAEIVFTVQQDIDEARALYNDIKTRAAAYGRSGDDIKIMPGLVPIVGRTMEEAVAKQKQVEDLLETYIGVAVLSKMVGTNLFDFPIDGPLPEVTKTKGAVGHQQTLMSMARRNSLSIRETSLRAAGVGGHMVLVGTPETIADKMEEWVSSGAADGFNIMPEVFPASLDDFVDLVVPELQRRGHFRRGYEGTTLRENLGLSAPASRWAAAEAK